MGKRVIEKKKEESACGNKIVLCRLPLYNILSVLHEGIYIKQVKIDHKRSHDKVEIIKQYKCVYFKRFL